MEDTQLYKVISLSIPVILGDSKHTYILSTEEREKIATDLYKALTKNILLGNIYEVSHISRYGGHLISTEYFIAKNESHALEQFWEGKSKDNIEIVGFRLKLSIID